MKEKKTNMWWKTLAVGLALVMFGMTALPAISQSYGTTATRESDGISSDYYDTVCAIEDSDPEEIEYDHFYQDLSQTLTQINQGQPTMVHFFQTDLQLQLERSELVPENATIYVEDDMGTVEYPMPAVAYTGTVLDPGGEEAALVITDDWISGYAVVGDTVYLNEVIPTDTPLYQPYRSWKVERPRDFNESQSDADENICEPPGTKRVSPGRMNKLNRLPNQGVDLQREPNPEPRHGWIFNRLVAHSDRNFYNLFWWCNWIGLSQWFCSFLRILSDLNSVSSIYRRDTSVIFSVPAIYICSVGNCGMTSTNAATLLNQFINHMTANHRNPRYHAAHLFTGKNLQGGTIGIAQLPGHYSLSQQVSEGWWTSYRATAYQRVILEAHEIGHNYNAIHGQAQRRRHWWPFWPFFHWHYTIMWTPFMGNNMIPDFSDANANRIHTHAHTKPLAP